MTENLLLVNDRYYYLDIDAISEFVKISPEDAKDYQKTTKSNKDQVNPSNMINITKYDLTKMMIDVVFNMGFSMEDTSDMDDTEKLIKGVRDDGFDTMLIPFKIAFNTLTINQIIKNYEPTNRKNKRGDSETKK